MNTSLRLRTLFAVAAATALLGACGGDDDDVVAAAPAPAATTGIPASATANSAGFIAYLTGLVGMNSDTGEPVLVGDAVLPTSDTTEAAN